MDADDEEEEKFWVERPADLFRIPHPSKSRAALFNLLTILVVVGAIILAILRFKYWFLVLTIGLIVVMFVYYNGRPAKRNKTKTPTEMSYDECKVALKRKKKMNRKNTRTAVSSANVEPFTLRVDPILEAPREASNRGKIPEDTKFIRKQAKQTQKQTKNIQEEQIKDTLTKKQLDTKRQFDSKRYQEEDAKDTFKLNNTNNRNTKPSNTIPNNGSQKNLRVGTLGSPLDQYYESLEDERMQNAYQFDVEEETMTTSAMC